MGLSGGLLTPHAFASAWMIAVGDVGGEDDVCMPFSSTPALALVFCALTLSASRRAAASSWRLVSSGSSLSASRAA